MKRSLPFVLLGLGALLLLWNLGSPALWQDEAETALRAESILDTGLPRMTLRGVLVTTQHSLVVHEGNAQGVWTWNTWLPAYLVAASFAVLGRTPFAARLPFALSGLLALCLAWRLFSDGEEDEIIERRAWAPETALALLALSPAFLLFCRQSRYYALLPLGTVLVLHSWRRLLAKKPWGALAVALCLQFLLHASFAFFACACLALMLDAVLRLDAEVYTEAAVERTRRAFAELATIEVEGQSGAGMVKVLMTCKHDVKRVTIDPSLLADDKDMLEDLVAAAFNAAVRKAEETSAEKMGKITAGMPGLPGGMKFPF